jgi:OmpA-OmpF porin, OOP family
MEKKHMKRIHTMSLSILSGLFILSCVLLTTGCATVPEKNAALERARAAYAQAQANPDINANAPVAVYEAAQALRKAEQAKDVEEMDHLAYLAERKAQIAVALAEQKIAENERERLSSEKEEILLDAREFEITHIRKEAEQAKKEAEAKTLESERSKGEAEALALQAEKARKVAEAKALEAEKSRLQTEQAIEQRKHIEREIAELKAKQTDRGIVLTLGDILFESGKANLMPGAIMTIDKLAEFLKKYPNRTVLIEGHTDSVGTETYNLGLSQRRAEALRTATISKGISSQRITTKGYGKRYPVASNATQAGRQQNRRVEIIILDEGKSGETLLK